MKTLKKALALVLAVSVMAVSGSALAAVQGTCTITEGSSSYLTNYDASAKSLTVEAEGANVGDQMTFVILDKDANVTNVAEGDILYVDQKTATAGDKSFTGKINLSRVTGASDEMPDGSYPVRIGYYNSAGVFQLGTGNLVISTIVPAAVNSVTTDATANATVGEALAITATVNAVGGASTAYTWTVTSRPDGSTANPVGDSFTPDKVGTYVLRATSNFDSTKYDEKTVIVADSAPNLTDAFIDGVTDAYTDETVTLTGTYTNSTKPNVTLTWSVEGDATLSETTGNTTVVTKTSVGSATVTLTATSATGVTVSKTHTIAFSTRPQVTGITTDATGTTPAGEALTVTATVTAVGGASTAYTWSVTSKPAGSTASFTGNSFVADKVGTYVVTATSDFDGSWTATKTITVTDPAPTLTSAIIEGAHGGYTDGTVTLTGSYVNGGKPNVTLTWSIEGEDATLSETTGNTTVVTKTSVGTATVTLTATSDTGVVKIATHEIVFSVRPQVTGVTITAENSVTVGESLAIAATASTLGDAGTTCTLTVTTAPAGATATISEGYFVANKVGTYVVTATADYDGTTTATKTITVNDSAPVLTSASIDGDAAGYTDGTVRLTGSFENEGKPGVTLTWDVSGVVKSYTTEGNDIIITPSGVGTVTVTLTATSETGVVKTDTHTIEFSVRPSGTTISVIWGDMNEDGVWNGNDASLALIGYTGGTKYFGHNFTLGQTKGGVLWGDVNEDGVWNGNDASLALIGYTGGTKYFGHNFTLGQLANIIVPKE